MMEAMDKELLLLTGRTQNESKVINFNGHELRAMIMYNLLEMTTI